MIWNSIKTTIFANEMTFNPTYRTTMNLCKQGFDCMISVEHHRKPGRYKRF